MSVAVKGTLELTARLSVRPDPCERIVFDSGNVLLGEFRCPTSYAQFGDAGRVVNFVLAFPRSAVWIQHERAPRFVADPSLATLYNPFAPFLREPISARGDETDWFALSETLARDLVRHFSARDGDAAEPFRFERADVPHAVYLAQRALFVDVAHGLTDRLEREERALSVATAVLASAYEHDRQRVVGGPRSREVVERAREIIMSTLAENLGVADIAARLEVSPFHLCRTFRAATGMTMHAYRRDVRLREALGLIPRHRGNLSTLALEIGFCSHAHFTAAFRRAFGLTPCRCKALD
jgi:AraC-like DNA-binding protein